MHCQRKVSAKISYALTRGICLVCRKTVTPAGQYGLRGFFLYTLLGPEIKHLRWRHLECLTQRKDYIQRNGAVRCLDPAHMSTANIDHFRQLDLGKIPSLSIVGNVQSQPSIIFLVCFLHRHHFQENFTHQKEDVRQRIKLFL